MDEEHPLTCGINGRWHVHNRVRDVVARLVTKHSQGTMAFVRSEPRGKDFHITVDSPIGPDAEFRQHGNTVIGSLSTTVGSPILVTLSAICFKPNALTLANTKFRWQRR